MGAKTGVQPAKADGAAKRILHTTISALALLALGAGLPQQTALAQQPSSAATSGGSERLTLSIPAQDLNAALLALASRASVQIGYEAAKVQGLRSAPVNGTLTLQEALAQMLAGTGYTYSVVSPTRVTLVELPRAGSAAVLPPLKVQGERGTEESAWGPVDGYVAKRSATGTKTDTPIRETPQSISVVTRDQMSDQGSRSLTDALRYTAGVAVEPFGADNRQDYIQTRGFDLYDNSFYRDGLRTNGLNYLYWSTEPYALERVELLRGPSSILYGQANPGGVVNQVSKRPGERAAHEAVLQAGSFDHKQGAFDSTGPLDADGRWLYRMVGLVRDSETQVDFVDQNRLFIAPSFSYRPNDQVNVTVLGEIQRDRNGALFQYLPAAGTVQSNPNGKIPSDRFVGEPDFDRYDRDQKSLGYLFEYETEGAWTFRQNARYRSMQVNYDFVYGIGFSGTDNRTLDRYAESSVSSMHGLAIDNQAEAKFDTGRFNHTLLFGLDYQRAGFRTKSAEAAMSSIDVFNPVYGAAIPALTPWLDNLVNTEQVGLYAQDQIKFDERWVLTLGARQDWASQKTENYLNSTHSKKDDNADTYRLGLVYLSPTGLSPYVSYSESFLPTSGVNLAGEPFKPTTGQQYEAGLRYQPPGYDSNVTVSAFDLRQQNVKTPDPNNNNNTLQTGEVTSRGFELEAVASLSDGLRLITSYGFVDAEVTKSNDNTLGKRPYNVAEHTASAWLDYTFQSESLRGFGLGGGVRYVGASYGDQANTIVLPDYTLFDAAIHYETGDGWRFALNGLNIFNKEYALCNSSASRCNYGTPATVLATVQYRW